MDKDSLVKEVVMLIDESIKAGEVSSSEGEDIIGVLEKGTPHGITEEIIGTGEEVKTVRLEEDEHKDIRRLISEMGIAQKIKCALLGGSVARALLIRDNNKLIQESVLKNPRLTLPEIEEFARNPNTPENILRIIGANKEWTRHYRIKLLLVMNPKSPPDISLRWLRYLNSPDLKNVARSKNIPQLIATTAKKRIDAMEREK